MTKPKDEFPDALCEFCGHPLHEGDEVMHGVCAADREAEWRFEHEREARYGA